MANPIRIHNPASLSDPTPLYYAHSSIVEPGSRMAYIAGQVGFDKEGNVSDDFPTQARQALANVKTCLAGLGATVRNIAFMNTYLVDYDAATSPIWDLHKEFLTDESGVYCPPGAVVPVPALAAPSLKIEVSCVVALPAAALPGYPTITDTDVFVVGAGLSGMQAATDVQKAGLNCVVLEAKDRVGGKTQCVEVNGGPGVLDIGGAWINDTTQPKMFALFQKFGFEALVQRTEGDEVFVKDGVGLRTRWPGLPPIGDEQQGIFNRIAEDMDRDALKIDLFDAAANTHIEDISLGEYFRSKGAQDDGDAFGFWRAWIRALSGTEPDAISLVYWLDYVKSAGGVQSLLSDGPDGAQYMTNRQGNQTISKRMAADLKPGSVKLKSPVTSITQAGSFTIVETSNGLTFRCRKVLISIPTPLYRHIKFNPPLPSDKEEYANSTHLGPYSKCILVYARPWWREAGLNGSFINLKGPVTFSRDVSSDKDGLFAISNLVFGEYATAWTRMPVSKRTQAIKDQIIEMLGAEKYRDVVNDTVETIEQHWAREPWIEGVPCPMPAPGGVWQRLGNALRTPCGSLHFIGTETAYEWKGYMEGAVRAGERGAAEVIEALKG